MKTILGLVFGLFLIGVGCTTLPSKQLMAESVLLQVELSSASEALLGLDLSSSERALAEAAVADLTAVTKQLDRSGANMVRVQNLIESPTETGRAILDDVVGAYLMAHLAYTGYLERTGAEPDMLLVRYDESAREVYTELDQLLRDNDGAISVGGLQGSSHG